MNIGRELKIAGILFIFLFAVFAIDAGIESGATYTTLVPSAERVALLAGERGIVAPASCGVCLPDKFGECTHDPSCPPPPAPPPPPPPPPPTNPDFSTGATTINSGDTATLTWQCYDSDSSSGVNFSTGGAVSGSEDVSPTETTEFTVICDNGGQSSVTVTVIDPNLSITATPDIVQSGDTSTIAWSAESVNSCSVSEDNPGITDSWSGDSGSETSSEIEQETTYTLSCETDGGAVSATATVRLTPVFEEF